MKKTIYIFLIIVLSLLFVSQNVLAQSYTNNNLNKPISNTLTATYDTINVSTSIILGDINLRIDTLTHTYDADVDIWLFAPNGDSVELSTDNGSSGDNFIGTVFDQAAATAITAGTAPFTGSFRPEGDLSLLNGSDGQGDWILRIVDDAGGDDGILQQWGIDLAPAPAVDLAISQFLNVPSSVIPASMVNFNIEVVSYGTDPVIADSLDLWVNGSVVSAYEYSALTVGERDTVNVSYTSGASGSDTVVASLRMVTGDADPTNDTLATFIAVANVATAPFFEDFETGVVGVPGTLPAGWTNETDDDWNWYVDAGGTPSSGTGPLVDHTLGTAAGIYIFTEASSHEHQLFNVTSPFVDVSGLTDPALTFWYHMAGTAVGELHVDVFDGLTWYLDVRAPFAGAQQAQADPWIMGAADISGYGNIIKVRFRAITGTFSSDIAVDDVSINEIALIPNDIVAAGFDMPYLTMIPLSQPTLLANIDVAGTFSNAGPSNTGDINLAIFDTAGVMVHSDMTTGVTIPSFSDSMFSFDVDASGADAGTYTAALFSSNFTDTVAANDTSWYSQTFGDQLAYDLGNWDYNVAYSATNVRNRFGVRYTLTEDDTLKNVTIAIGSATGTDSFSVDLFTSDADTPSVLLYRLYRGIIDSVGASSVVVFDAPNILLTPGDYWIVYDLDNQATSTYGLGADAQAQGAVNVTRRFGWQIPGLAWSYWENASNAIFGTLTPIIRMGLSGVPPYVEPPDPSIIYADDFEAYTAGTQLTVQNSVDWQTWSGTPGTAEDPFVSTNYANSGVNSVNIITNNDCVKPMPNYTTGAYKISFDMYIPTGTVAYFNTLQEFTPTPQWGMQVQFNAGGNGDIDGGGQAAATFTYAYDTWLHNEVWVNLEKDTAEYYIDGVRIHGWKWTDGTFGTTVGPLQLGGNNFYGGGPTGTFNFYIDDYELKEISPAIFADDFDSYVAGTQLVVQNSVDWRTWSAGGAGTGEDPFVSDAYSNSGPNSVVIMPNNDLVKTYGSKTSGVWSIAFNMYIPNGQAGYFNTMAGFDPNTNSWAMWVDFNVGGGAVLDGVPGSPVAFTYAYDTWQMVEVIIDLDQDLAELHLDGAVIHQWQWTDGGTTPLRLDATDFFGATANDEMYIDDYVFDTAASLTPNSIGDGTNALPTTFDLAQNYPNPFNPTTTIKYQLPKKADVKIVIYNMLGQVVRTIVDKSVDAGYQEVVWDGLNDTGNRVATGVYIYRMETDKFVKAHKMIMMK